MRVVDASALLAYLQDETGAALVEEHLLAGAAVSAANWSEVAQKVLSRGLDWAVARALLDSFGMEVVPVGAEDAEGAARLWEVRPSLSLADRLCLALAARLGATALTADRAWGEGDGVEQIR